MGNFCGETKITAGNMGLCKLGLTRKHQQIANPGCCSGWTNNFEL